MVLTFIFLFIVLKPAPDNEEFIIKRQLEQLSDAAKQQLQLPSPLKKAAAMVSGAFLDFLVPSIAFLLLSAAWCLTRRRLLLFALPIACMIALYSVVHGYAHHHGTVLIAAITALWIAWPTRDEQQSMTEKQAWAFRGMIVPLCIYCFVNIWDAAVVIKREYRFPYSGADDAAQYLKSVGADRGPMFGLLYGVAAVQARFDHNIFANLPTTYFHHGFPLVGTVLDTDALDRIQPEYIVAYSDSPEQMMASGTPLITSRGYQLVHFSDGYYLYKSGCLPRSPISFFRRVQP